MKISRATAAAGRFNRREFLKLAVLSSAALGLFSGPRRRVSSQVDRPKFLILLFDTLAARNMRLYGYTRRTTPNINRFAENAIVYNAHRAAGNFTVPSTGSLLTGTYPWTHRAFFGPPVGRARQENLFGHMPPDYFRAAFTQNVLADLFLHEYALDLNLHLQADEYSLTSSPAYQAVHSLVGQDALLADISTVGFYFSNRNRAGSLFLSVLDRALAQAMSKYHIRREIEAYPQHLPSIWLHNAFFKQEQVFDGLVELLRQVPSPHLTYLHLWSPHEPYRPGRDFTDRFQADIFPPAKGIHHFGQKSLGIRKQNEYRRAYDAGLAHVDFEFGRLMATLEAEGILDDTYVIVTSDHGQMFERGVHGHVTPLMYEPLLHIPLIIRPPRQQGRLDIDATTSNADLMPTILHLAGQEIPDWCEGEVLPGLGGRQDPDRPIFAMEARDNPAVEPIRNATLAMYKGDYKLIQYLGYPNYPDQYELYHLGNDPEELDDLAASPLAAELSAELLARLGEINRVDFRSRS